MSRMPVHGQSGQSKAAIPKRIRLLGILAASIFTIIMPGIYIAISIISIHENLETEATLTARSIGKIVQSRPELWEFEIVRLKELISDSSLHEEAHEEEIRTASGSGKLVIKTETTIPRPVMSASAPFFDTGQLAGSLIIRHTIRPQLLTTALLAIFCSFLGTLFYKTFCTYPIRQLEETMAALQRAHEEMEQQVAERTEALSRANDELRIKIDEHQRMEDELRESEERFKDISLSMADWIWESDQNGKYTYCSGKIDAILGYSSEQIIGKTPFDLMTADEVERVSPIFQEIFAAKKPIIDVQNWALHKNGTKVCLVTNGKPLLDKSGALLGYRGVDRDITKRMHAETALRESEERYRTLFVSASDAILTLAPPSWLFTSGNPATIKMFEAGDEAAFTKLGPWDVSPEFQPDGRPSSEKASEMIQRAMTKGSNYFEWTHCRHGGESFHATVLFSRMEIDGQAILQATVRDISVQKALEADLRKSYDDLTNLQAQLIQTSKLAAIGELAAGIAHELNQPLMILRSKNQLIQRRLQKETLTPEYIGEAIEMVDRNTKRMMNIINHLRAFSRQSGQTEQTRELVQLNKVIDDCFLMIGEQLRLRDIQIKKEFDPDLPKIKADGNQLEQVFLNLLANARDAVVERREKCEEKESYQAEIAIHTAMSDDRSHIVVLLSDNGCGIPPGMEITLFDPFVTSKEVGKGTGLGLSISYGIIQKHGGQIRVAKSSPEGTTFSVELPVS
jgi:PAS domain S-box-containing protein